MRITNKMLSNNFLRDMRTNLTNLKTLQEQMTSGKEVRRPSDNPFKVARSMQLHTEINTNKQYNNNIKDTINWLETTDTALGQAGDILHRVRELLVSSGDGAYSDSERRAIKDEINQKISEFSQVMNTNFDGKYIFGGTRGTTKPMDVVGGSSFAGAAETVGLNFSGVESLVDKTTGNLKNDIKIEFKFDSNKNGSIDSGEKETITISAGTSISDLKDLTDKVNNKINSSTNSWLKNKIEVVPDASNNKLKFVNKNSNPDLNKFIVNSFELGVAAEAVTLRSQPSSNALNFSRVESLIANGKLKDDLTVTIAGKLITIAKDTPINNLSDLSSKINEQIAADSSIKDIVKVVTNIADGTLKFVNMDSTDTTGIPIISSTLFATATAKTATFNKNNNENARLFYYKKGGGELLSGAECDQIGENLKVEISQGVVFDYNVNARQVVEFKNQNGEDRDLREIFNNIVNHLDGKDNDGKQVDADAVKKLVNADLQDITDTMNNILKLRSEVGAKQNSMESAKNKNTDQNFNMTEILSKTEDIDITEKTMELATAITVYTASLQTSARVIQPTLMDYIR